MFIFTLPRRWVLGHFIENHLQSSQGSTRSTGSGQDGFVSMEAIDLNLEAVQNHESVHNGKYAFSVAKRQFNAISSILIINY